MISPLGRPAEGIALLIARQLLKQWTPRALLGLVRAHTSRSVLRFRRFQYVLGQTLTADLASLDCAASKTKSLAIDCLGQVPLTLSIFYGSLGTECRTLLVQRLRSCPGSRTK